MIKKRVDNYLQVKKPFRGSHHHHYVRHHQKQENLKIKVTTLHGYRYLAKGGLSTLIWFYHITNNKC